MWKHTHTAPDLCYKVTLADFISFLFLPASDRARLHGRRQSRKLHLFNKRQISRVHERNQTIANCGITSSSLRLGQHCQISGGVTAVAPQPSPHCLAQYTDPHTAVLHHICAVLRNHPMSCHIWQQVTQVERQTHTKREDISDKAGSDSQLRRFDYV